MGAASYNRGSRRVSEYAEQDMQAASQRADRQAYKDEIQRLRLQVAWLERDLARARRCLAATRLSHDQRMAESRAALRDADSSISILCRLAFPEDAK